MKKEKKKNKKSYLGTLWFIAMGVCCGIFAANFLEQTSGDSLTTVITISLLVYVGIFFHLIAHEAGHLVAGLMTGYRFLSFRIMSFMWQKENGEIHFKRFSLAGTGGQCLMIPPNLVDGTFHVVLYNMGGSLMNLFTAIIFFILSYLLRDSLLWYTAFGVLGIIGFFIAAMNGIPMRLGTIDNDGYNTISIKKNPEAKRAFWLQMKINELNTSGIRLKDMPEEWFELPSDEAMENNMVATIGVLAAGRLMDEGRFEEANKLMTHMIDHVSGIEGIYRRLMICDKIFLELIGENRSGIIDALYNKEQKVFMKQMKQFPSVLRTEYALALFYEKNEVKAEQVKATFEKIAKTYPYANDIATERELMVLLDNHKEK